MEIKYLRNSPFTKYTLTVFLLAFWATLPGCKKYLDKKPVKTQVVPSTLADLQALMDNRAFVQQDDPILTELLADNYYLRDVDWQREISRPASERKSAAQHYIWDGNAIPFDNSWIIPYQGKVYISNVVLDYIDRVAKNEGEEDKYNYVKGAALFLRSFAFERLTHLYCKPYDESTAETDLGLVLRTTAAIDAPSTRSTVQQSYDLILKDLKQAATLLPPTTAFPTQPNKVAALGALARTYLSMRNYEMAGKYADDALQINHQLMDYNDLSSPQVPIFNPEVVFHSVARNTNILSSSFARIDTILARSYHVNDLRREVFFRASSSPPGGHYAMRGSYSGTDPSSVFDGITTDELYLIRAECYAKAGNVSAAMADLNTLMEKRWMKTQWTPFDAANAPEALQIIRTERRKELVYRGHRWPDIRRYNMEDSSITLQRVIAGTTYTLPPNDKRSIMLIPLNVVKLSGITQNPR